MKVHEFKVGDRVNAFMESYSDKEGIITNIYNTVDKKTVYRVVFNTESEHSHIQYFNLNELDLSIKEKRDRRLKELGI